MIRSRLAFSLLELSVVMVVLSLILGFGINLGAGALKAADRVTTQERLNTIKLALDNYVQANGYLPCPARRDVSTSNSGFGVESRTGTYTGSLGGTAVCSGSSPGFVQIGTGAGNVFIGAVPTRTLGLPDAYAGDAWGSKLTYAVSAPHVADRVGYYRNDGSTNRDTSGNGQISIRYGDRTGTNYSLTTITSHAGNPAAATISPNSSALVPASATNAATYVVVSHGRDRRGAFPMNGTSVPTGRRCIATAVNTSPMPCNTSATSASCNDVENCDDGAIATNAAVTTGGAVFYDTQFNDGDNAAQYFDDYIVWGTNTQVRAPINPTYYNNTGECAAGTACNLWCASCSTEYPANTAYTPSDANFKAPILCHKFITSVYGSACTAHCSWGGTNTSTGFYSLCP